MENMNVIDILLVEDNPQDAELMIRALRKRNILNPLHVVEDGAAALGLSSWGAMRTLGLP